MSGPIAGTGTRTVPSAHAIRDQRVGVTAAPTGDASGMTPTGPRRRSRTATLALLTLVITTGWTQAAAANLRAADSAAALPASVSAPDAARVAFDRVLGTMVRHAASAVVAANADAVFRIRDQARQLDRPAVSLGTGLAPASVPASTYGDRRPPGAVSSAYSGRNRFWIPSLGINYRVHLFECTRKREPDHFMYRWGCAGSKNVYILGHASSVMRPLHDLFERGGLEVGMLALYAGDDGVVRAFRVTEWRVVDPVDSHWAIADQPVPSMTLQTCVGKNGVDRLNVRLVEVR